MKRWIGLALLVFIGAAGWRIGGALSPDALSMAVGLLFGILAGVPTALLVMAGSRRRNSEERAEESRVRQQQGSPMNGWSMPYPQQPPIIVVAGPQGMGGAPQLPQHNAGWHPQEPPARQFTVVGDREELGEDW
jgi:hypothetical protein